MVVLAIEHIVQTPGTCGGKPRIAGTRVRVQDVAAYHNGGMGIEEMVDQFDLTPGQVYAALAYYYDHREEIEREMVTGEEIAGRLLAEGRASTSADLLARFDAPRDE